MNVRISYWLIPRISIRDKSPARRIQTNCGQKKKPIYYSEEILFRIDPKKKKYRKQGRDETKTLRRKSFTPSFTEGKERHFSIYTFYTDELCVRHFCMWIVKLIHFHLNVTGLF